MSASGSTLIRRVRLTKHVPGEAAVLRYSKDSRLKGGVRGSSEWEEERSWAFGDPTFFPSAHAPERFVDTSVRDFGYPQETICNSTSYFICRQEQGAGVTIPEEERIPFWRR